jgi:hypothetical protein
MLLLQQLPPASVLLWLVHDQPALVLAVECAGLAMFSHTRTPKHARLGALDTKDGKQGVPWEWVVSTGLQFACSAGAVCLQQAAGRQQDVWALLAGVGLCP